MNTVDFDELFARGHAMSAQFEQLPTTMNGHISPESGSKPPLSVTAAISQVTATATSAAPAAGTPFEVYSKDEAWKKSQKGAGIGYAEKVYIKVQEYIVRVYCVNPLLKLVGEILPRRSTTYPGTPFPRRGN